MLAPLHQLPATCRRGYFQGKRDAERYMAEKLPAGEWCRVWLGCGLRRTCGTADVPAVCTGVLQGCRLPTTERRTFALRVAGGVALRPGFIYGTRAVGSTNLHLGWVGAPLKAVSGGSGGWRPCCGFQTRGSDGTQRSLVWETHTKCQVW